MDNLYELAKERLRSFAVEVDEMALRFTVSRVQEHIQNFCNITEIPAELTYTAASMICGEYLNQMQKPGKLDAETFPIDAAIKAIEEGDVKITFMDSASAEDRLAAFISYLLDVNAELLAFRRLRW